MGEGERIGGDVLRQGVLYAGATGSFDGGQSNPAGPRCTREKRHAERREQQEIPIHATGLHRYSHRQLSPLPRYWAEWVPVPSPLPSRNHIKMSDRPSLGLVKSGATKVPEPRGGGSCRLKSFRHSRFWRCLPALEARNRTSSEQWGPGN